MSELHRPSIAYILINVESGYEEEVLEKLVAVEEVKEVYLLHGVYDILVKVVANGIDRVREVVALRIRRLDKVKSTTTMMVEGV